MRRRRLRERIRQQRRLTRRLVTRHVLARRVQPVARMLEAIGAWFQPDESIIATRFVPPLLEHESVSPAAVDGRAAPVVHVEDEVDDGDRDADALQETTGISDDVSDGGASGRTVRHSTRAIGEGSPNRDGGAPRADRSADAPNATARALGDVLPAIGPSHPTTRSTPGTPRDARAIPALPAARRSDAAEPVGARPGTRKGASASTERTTPSSMRPDTPVPIVPGRDGVPAGAAAHVPDSVPASSSRAPDSRSAPSHAPRAERPEVRRVDEQRTVDVEASVDSAVRDGPGPNATPDVATPETDSRSSSQASAGADPRSASAATNDTATDSPSVERTAHAEILERALGALRATGELPPSRREPSASGPPSRTSPAGIAPLTAPASEVSSPRPTNRTASPPPPSTPTASDRSRVQPVGQARDDDGPIDSLDTPSLEQAPVVRGQVAASDGAMSVVPSEPAAAQSSSLESAASESAGSTATSVPRRENPADARPRVDEQRQARRPAHLDRPRLDPSAAPNAAPNAAPVPPATPAPGSVRPTSYTTDRAPTSDGQFRFTDVERSPQEWRQLLIEATAPPGSAARSRATTHPGSATREPSGQPTASRSGTHPAGTPRSPVQTSTQAATIRTPSPTKPQPRVRQPMESAAVASATARRASDTEHRQPGPRIAPGVDAPAPPSGGADAVVEEMRSTPTLPVSPSARRFLRPLVGIDPDSVRIHRGAQAAALAARHDADAIAVGDDIAIGAGHDDREPAGLALLAHELTHSARARDRRFVPPVARAGPAPDGGTATGSRHVSRGTVAANDEETIAHVVETRTYSAAKRGRGHDAAADTGGFEHDVTTDDAVGHEPEGSADGSNGGPLSRHTGVGHGERARPAARRADASPWGALPAPWEPLPATLAQSRAGDVRPNGNGSTLSGTGAPALPPAPHSADAAPAVYRAERGGGSAGEEPAHAEPATPAAEGPDIDVLARQVYDVLKRRLAAESRRGA